MTCAEYAITHIASPDTKRRGKISTLKLASLAFGKIVETRPPNCMLLPNLANSRLTLRDDHSQSSCAANLHAQQNDKHDIRGLRLCGLVHPTHRNDDRGGMHRELSVDSESVIVCRSHRTEPTIHCIFLHADIRGRLLRIQHTQMPPVLTNRQTLHIYTTAYPLSPPCLPPIPITENNTNRVSSSRKELRSPPCAGPEWRSHGINASSKVV